MQHQDTNATRPCAAGYVYWNSNKRLYSVKDRASGLVRGREALLVVHDARFIVSATGRDRARRQGRRTQHAGVSGDVRAPSYVPDVSKMERIKYSPLEAETFVRASDGMAVVAAAEVVMTVEDGRARMFARGLRTRGDRL